MGAPVILSEKLVAGVETPLALEAMQRVLAGGVFSGEGGEDGRRGSERVRVSEREIGGGKKVWIADPTDLGKIDVSNPAEIKLVCSTVLHGIRINILYTCGTKTCLGL